MSTTPELASVDELLDELVTRFHGMIFAGRIVNTQGHTPEDIYRSIRWRFQGDELACIGLAEHVKDQALGLMRQRSEPMSPGE